MDNKNNIFDLLKKPKKNFYKIQKKIDILFLINFDANGAFLQIVDQNKQKVSVNYENYQGKTRDIIKVINKIEEKNSLNINWNEKNDNIYLKNYEYLIWSLKECKRLIDNNMEQINFENENGELFYIVKHEKDIVNCNVIINYNGKIYDKFKFLSEDYILFNNNIIRIQPIGENFNYLNFFNTKIFKNQLEDCLSIFFSNFNNIKLKYMDYKVTDGPDLYSKPTITFEEVGQDDSLHFSITSSLPNKPTSFFDNYDISKICIINELEKKIIVSNYISESIEDHKNNIEKKLKIYQKQVKTKSSYYLHDNFFILDKELASIFLQNELSKLVYDFQLIGSEKLKKYRIKRIIPKLNLSLKMGTKFYLEGNIDVDLDGNNYNLFEVLSEYKKNSYILLNDGSKAIIDENYLNKLRRIFKKDKNKVKLSFFDTPLIEDLIDDSLQTKIFKKSKEIFLGFNKLEKEKAELPLLNGTLRNYQVQGFKWLIYLSKNLLGGCLADDMGLGKTVQAIALLSAFYPDEQKPSLIIMPRTLLFNWQKEIEKFNPGLKTYIYHGLGRDLKKINEFQLILTTYSTVRNDIEKLKEIDFFYTILDESQNIKNLATQANKAIMLLKNKHRLALSGTPLENNLDELFALFRFLNPAMFGSLTDFHTHYTYPIQKQEDKDVMQELKKKIYPFILRRLKQEVLTELPEKVEQVIYVDMSEEQKLLYEQKRNYYYNQINKQIKNSGINKSQFFILQALTELRQIASIPESKSDFQIISPKREVLLENLLEAIANNHKVLIFANYLDAIEVIGQDLAKNAINYQVMTGATTNREQLVKEFQENDEVKVFLLTLKTGGVGLNLTASDRVFIFDPWWNKSVENQAIDRVHRIGQNKTVFSYKFITRNTIEEKILILQNKKMQLLNNIISSDSAGLKSLNEKDIEYIFGV